MIKDCAVGGPLSENKPLIHMQPGIEGNMASLKVKARKSLGLERAKRSLA
jgi:hypothetical protein